MGTLLSLRGASTLVSAARAPGLRRASLGLLSPSCAKACVSATSHSAPCPQPPPCLGLAALTRNACLVTGPQNPASDLETDGGPRWADELTVPHGPSPTFTIRPHARPSNTGRLPSSPAPSSCCPQHVFPPRPLRHTQSPLGTRPLDRLAGHRPGVRGALARSTWALVPALS